MQIELAKQMMDACYKAKRIHDLLPALPAGVTASYIHYLDAIETVEQEGRRAKISDISDRLRLPRPGVTRTVKEMERRGYLQKEISSEDGRITYLTITRRAERCQPGTTASALSRLPLIWRTSRKRMRRR